MELWEKPFLIGSKGRTTFLPPWACFQAPLKYCLFWDTQEKRVLFSISLLLSLKTPWRSSLQKMWGLNKQLPILALFLYLCTVYSRQSILTFPGSLSILHITLGLYHLHRGKDSSDNTSQLHSLLPSLSSKAGNLRMLEKGEHRYSGGLDYLPAENLCQ